MAEGTGTSYAAKCGVTAGIMFWQRSTSAQQAMCDVRDDSLCAAGAQHVAYLVPEKYEVLESVTADSSVIAGKRLCALFALFGMI